MGPGAWGAPGRRTSQRVDAVAGGRTPGAGGPAMAWNRLWEPAHVASPAPATGAGDNKARLLVGQWESAGSVPGRKAPGAMLSNAP